MGMEDLKVGWLVWLAKEVHETKNLPNCESSLENYWSGTIYDDEQRSAYLNWLQSLREAKKQSPSKEGAKKRRERSASPKNTAAAATTKQQHVVEEDEDL